VTQHTTYKGNHYFLPKGAIKTLHCNKNVAHGEVSKTQSRTGPAIAAPPHLQAPGCPHSAHAVHGTACGEGVGLSLAHISQSFQWVAEKVYIINVIGLINDFGGLRPAVSGACRAIRAVTMFCRRMVPGVRGDRIPVFRLRYLYIHLSALGLIFHHFFVLAPCGVGIFTNDVCWLRFWSFCFRLGRI